MGLVNILKIGHRVISANAGSCMAELLEDVVIIYVTLCIASYKHTAIQ